MKSLRGRPLNKTKQVHFLPLSLLQATNADDYDKQGKVRLARITMQNGQVDRIHTDHAGAQTSKADEKILMIFLFCPGV